MLHLIFCVRRLPHLSRSEFQRYWREHHAPLVRSHAAALGIRRYVQEHTVEHPVAQSGAAARGAPEPFDGVAEIWFEDQNVMQGADAETIARASRELLEDERRFVDLANSPIFIAEDHVVIEKA